jgi:1-deoxy-D-xylulose-5-phosphate reductoisomerase
MPRKKLIILGATGTIGRQTLDVARKFPELFEVVGLSAHRDSLGLESLAREFPLAKSFLSFSGTKERNCDAPAASSGNASELLCSFIEDTDADMVVNGIAGSAGLAPSLASLASGKDLALANKESVVMGYGLLKASAKSSGKSIIPVDSEHAALFQLVSRVGAGQIVELVITASGGAFRDLPLELLHSVSPDQASCHPTWNMGRKITIDSASMANKGLEVIEAVRLFDFQPSRVKVLVHPQSYVHALVRTSEGSLYAQISDPDMRLPIQNALTWPEQFPCAWGRLDLAGRNLEFREPDPKRYPLLELAYRAVAAGEGHTVAYNAADEVAVAAFEAGRIRFTDIPRVVEAALSRDLPSRLADIGSIFEVDSLSRLAAFQSIPER